MVLAYNCKGSGCLMPSGHYDRKAAKERIRKRKEEEIKKRLLEAQNNGSCINNNNKPVLLRPAPDVKLMQDRLEELRQMTGLDLFVCTVSHWPNPEPLNNPAPRYVITEESDSGYVEVSPHYERLAEINGHLFTAYNIAKLMRGKQAERLDFLK